MSAIKAYASLGLLLALLAGGWYYGHTRYAAGQLDGNTRVATLTAQHAEQLQHLAELTTAASEAARAAEQAQAAGFAATATQYEQDKTHAQDQAGRVVADLRAGALRLRQQWTCAPLTAPLKCPAPQPLPASLMVSPTYEQQVWGILFESVPSATPKSGDSRPR